MAGKYEYVIGMDCGTTNLKAAALRNDGFIAARESVSNVTLSPGLKMREQDPEMLWHNAVKIFNSIAAQLGPEEMRQVRAVSISSHTVSLLPVDVNGRPVRNAVIYQDSRSSDELARIVEHIGRERDVSIAGGQPSTAFLPGKLLWYAENEPDLYEKTAYFLQVSSYLNYKLTGIFSCDIDQSLRTQCMDVRTQDWSPEIAAAADVDLKEKMPALFSIDDVIGEVTKEAAQQTGLMPGIPVLAGCSDAMASMYATGISRSGEAGESSGTTSLVFVGSEVPGAPDDPVTARPCAIKGIPWVFDAPIQSSGAALKWYIDTMAQEERAYAKEHGLNIYTYLNQLALKANPGCGGLIFFPYLMGERAPLWNDHASAMFIGMRMNMSRADLARSVFEGTAYALRHVIETVRQSGGKAQLLRICGGGAASRTWNLIKASMLNMPVYVLDPESGDVPVGDALIAGCKAGLFSDLGEASEKVVKIAEVIDPIPEWTRAYDQIYPHFLNLYRCMDSELAAMYKTVKKM